MSSRAFRSTVTSPRSARTRLATALAVLLLVGCSTSDGNQTSGGDEIKPEGDPDQLTVVDQENIAGISEATLSNDDDIQVEVAYPEIPNAEPLTERLGSILDREASDFADAVPDAEAFTVDWNISVAGDDAVAVRLAQTEKTADDEHTRHSTYWYDASTGVPRYSTELLAGQEELDTLNDLVSDALEGQDDLDVDTEKLHAIMRLYDSVGFNPDGDLVAEFDPGEVAPTKAGPVTAVIGKEEADPLLSEFGEQAKDAATVVAEDFEVPMNEPKDGDSNGPVPGLLPVRDNNVDCTTAESKCVALTFDDGPGEQTPELLDAFAEHNAKATFFLTGEPLRENPDTLRREYAEGHEIANHTDAHPDLTSINSDKIENELAPVDAMVHRETGHETTLMRPPYGATDDSSAEVSKDLGMAEILWSVDTNDWKNRDADKVVSRTMDEVEPGSIVLMHDIHGSTVDAMPELLEKLNDEGFTMVTVSQLLGETEPGEKYRDGHPEDENDDEDEDDSEDTDGDV